MTLKAFVSDVSTLDESVQSMYKETEGGYVLDVEEADGYSLENVSGLKSALGKERSSVDELTKKVRKYEKQYEGVDPEEYRTVKAEYERLVGLDPEKEADKIADAKINDKLTKKQKEWQKQHEETVAPLTAKLSVYEEQLHKLMVENTINSTLADNGVLPGYAELLASQARSSAKLVDSDGVPVVAVMEGNTPRVRGDGQNMTVADLVAEYKEKYPDMFSAKFKSGGGSMHSSRGAAPAKKELNKDEAILAGLKERGWGV